MTDDNKPVVDNNGSFQEDDDEGLDVVQPKKTSMLDMSNMADYEPMRPRIPTPNTQLLQSGSRIIFHVSDQRKIFTVTEDSRVVVGRVPDDEAQGTDIHFDLTPFGAYHFGVSRQHAIIKLRDGYLYLEDLGSTNGTRINGFQLTTHQPYRMRDGDEIEFGKLRTSIRFRTVD